MRTAFQLSGRRGSALLLAGVVLAVGAPALGVSAAPSPARSEISEPVVMRRLSAISDPGFPRQWALSNEGRSVQGSDATAGADIDAPAAWQLQLGRPDVVVAVIDDGVMTDHPDLSSSIWSNPAEIVNGRDDDGNGLIDDVRGWDFVDGDANPAPYLDEPHGTHVAGIVAAELDDAGTVGVAPGISILPLRVCSDGWCTSTAVTAAIEYARNAGVDIINLSLGGTYSQREDAAIAASPEQLFVIAAGNAARDNDATPEYPCALPHANILCVAASTARDELASFSSYGRARVDVAAPGQDLLSTMPGWELVNGRRRIVPAWGFLSGTSMAAPVASGVAALAASACEPCGMQALRQAVLRGAEPRSALTGYVATNGRVDAYRTVTLARRAGVFSAMSAPLARGGRVTLRLIGRGLSVADPVTLPAGVVESSRRLEAGHLILELRASRTATLGMRPISVQSLGNSVPRACAACVQVVEASALTSCPNPQGLHVLFGTRGDDVLRGGPGREIVCGLGGSDALFGGAGADTLFGGSGGDRLTGGLGQDRLWGGDHYDRCQVITGESRSSCEAALR